MVHPQNGPPDERAWASCHFMYVEGQVEVVPVGNTGGSVLVSLYTVDALSF